MAAKEKATTSVVAQKEVSSEIAAYNDDFAQYANAGMENVGISDVLIPRLTILQALSPQINPRKAEHIDGAAVGMICDVGTSDLFPDGILFVPCYYRKDYLEWAPRATGKGLVAVHDSDAILSQCQRNEKNQPILPNGNLIAETAQWFGINVTADGRKSFLPMSSTQLKRSRRWMTLATGEKLARADGSTFTPPLFYRAYNLTTVDETNNEGDWSGWKVERGPSLPELGGNWRALRDECVAFREQMIAGKMRGDLSDLGEENSGGSSNSEGAM